MSFETENFEIPVTIKEVHSPDEIYSMAHRLHKHCSDLETTVNSRIIVKDDATEIANELYDLVERLGWYFLSQLEIGRFERELKKQGEIIDYVTSMHQSLLKVILSENERGKRYKPTEVTKSIEEEYLKLTEEAA